MFTRSIAVFAAAVVLVTVSPAMAQSSDLLASAERLALMTEVGQDQSVVRRRRSGGLAWTGGGLAVGGIVLALRPPVCELQGSETGTSAVRGRVRYQATLGGSGACELVQLDDFGEGLTWSESEAGPGGRMSITKRTWNYVGWATAAAGGVLMWYGLRGVDVPVRFDVASRGRIRVFHSLDW